MATKLMELKPERLREWEVDSETERVVIFVPKIRGRLLSRLLRQRLKEPYHKIDLDEFGSVVWQSCDGDTSVRAIGEILRQRFGDTIEPLYDRLSLFLEKLKQNNLIRYSNLQEVSFETTNP